LKHIIVENDARKRVLAATLKGHANALASLEEVVRYSD